MANSASETMSTPGSEPAVGEVVCGQVLVRHATIHVLSRLSSATQVVAVWLLGAGRMCVRLVESLPGDS